MLKTSSCFNANALNPGLCSVEIEAEDYILSPCLESGLRSRWVRSYASVKNAFMLQYTSQFHSHSRSRRQLVGNITETKTKLNWRQEYTPKKKTTLKITNTSHYGQLTSIAGIWERKSSIQCIFNPQQ